MNVSSFSSGGVAPDTNVYAPGCIIKCMRHFSRRRFLNTAAAVSASGVLARAAAEEHSLKTIGVQLYTVRTVLPKQPLETLKEIDQIGYSEAECLHDGLDKIWASLKETRLKPVSMHLETSLFAPPKAGELNAVIADAKQRGFQYLVYPYVAPQERGGLDVMRKLAQTLNAAGEKCRDAGLHLCYHNHAFEFQPMEGATPFQVLLQETKKDLVGLEMDVFWVSVAGHDPVEMLRQQAGRVPLVHLKDKALGTAVQFNESVPRTAFKEVGNGTLDFPAILRAASAAGVQHYFVEQDATPGDPLASLRQSYEYVHSLKF